MSSRTTAKEPDQPAPPHTAGTNIVVGHPPRAPMTVAADAGSGASGTDRRTVWAISVCGRSRHVGGPGRDFCEASTVGLGRPRWSQQTPPVCPGALLFTSCTNLFWSVTSWQKMMSNSQILRAPIASPESCSSSGHAVSKAFDPCPGHPLAPLAVPRRIVMRNSGRRSATPPVTTRFGVVCRSMLTDWAPTVPKDVALASAAGHHRGG